MMSVPCNALRKMSSKNWYFDLRKPAILNGNSGNSSSRSMSKLSKSQNKHHTFDSSTLWVLSYDLHTLQRTWAEQARYSIGNVPDPFRAVIKWSNTPTWTSAVLRGLKDIMHYPMI